MRISRAADRAHSKSDRLESRSVQFDSLTALAGVKEDRLDAGATAACRPTQNLEIVSFVLDGHLEYTDTAGARARLRPGDAQRRRLAGSAVEAEFHASSGGPLRLVQFWFPLAGTAPESAYEARRFPPHGRAGRLQRIACAGACEGALSLESDAECYVAALEAGESVRHQCRGRRGLVIHVIGGGVAACGAALDAGDSLASVDGDGAVVTARARSEILLLDVPADAAAQRAA